MKRQNVLKLFLPAVLLLSFLLAACGGSTTTPDTNTTQIDYNGTITIWHNWEGDYLKAKQAVFQEYMDQHKGVKIELVFQGKDNVNQSITAVRNHAGPDIIADVDDSLGKLALGQIVIPLDQYLSADFINQTYSKPAAEAVTFQKKIWGVPDTVEALTMMYNKNLIKEGDLPKTTDELLAFQKKYHDAGKYGLVWNVSEPYFNAPLYNAFGTTFVSEDGQVGLNTPAGIAASKYLASMREYLPSQLDYDVASSLFTEGKAMAIINGPWSYADYATKAKMDIGFANIPTVASTNTPGKPFVGVKSLWVSKVAKNVPLAVDILKFYTNKDHQVAQAKANGEIPANQEAAASTEVTSLPAIAGFASQIQFGTALPNTPYMSAVWDPMKSSLAALWNGSQTAEQAMATAQKVAEENVAKLK